MTPLAGGRGGAGGGWYQQTPPIPHPFNEGGHDKRAVRSCRKAVRVRNKKEVPGKHGVKAGLHELLR